MRHILLSPHLDDAVLSLGGLLAKYGPDCVVITVFAGRPEKARRTLWDMLCGFRNSDRAMDARLQENLEALRTLRVPDAQVINLPYLDGQYRHDSPSVEDLVRSLESTIAPLLSTDNRLYGPSQELHPDHRLVKRAFTALAKNVAASCFYYDDLPYAADSRPSDAGEIDVVPLTEEDMDTKLEAISRYASQMLPLSYAGGLRRRIRRFGAARARVAASDAPYAEIVYALD